MNEELVEALNDEIEHTTESYTKAYVQTGSALLTSYFEGKLVGFILAREMIKRYTQQ